MSKPGWENHEEDVAKIFGLRRTISSGNRFFDPGDAVSPDSTGPFPIYAEAKYTEKDSFTLKRKDLRKYWELAFDTNKHLIMPIRFWPRGARMPDDYVLLGLHDLQELIERYRDGERALAEGDWA